MKGLYYFCSNCWNCSFALLFSQSVLGFGSVWLWKFAGCKGAMFKGWRKRTYKLFFYIVGIAPLHLRIFLIYFLGLCCLWKDCIIFVPIVGIAASHFWIFSVCFGFWIRVIVKICREDREPRIERWKLRVGSGGWSSRGGFVCEWAAM